jgi:hypothetical protein
MRWTTYNRHKAQYDRLHEAYPAQWAPFVVMGEGAAAK